MSCSCFLSVLHGARLYLHSVRNYRHWEAVQKMRFSLVRDHTYPRSGLCYELKYIPHISWCRRLITERYFLLELPSWLCHNREQRSLKHIHFIRNSRQSVLRNWNIMFTCKTNNFNERWYHEPWLLHVGLLVMNMHWILPEENAPIIGYIIILTNKEYQFELSFVSTN